MHYVKGSHYLILDVVSRLLHFCLWSFTFVFALTLYNYSIDFEFVSMTLMSLQHVRFLTSTLCLALRIFTTPFYLLIYGCCSQQISCHCSYVYMYLLQSLASSLVGGMFVHTHVQSVSVLYPVLTSCM